MPTVLILGATSDVGYAIARKFASEKYDVQLAARNTHQILPLQSDLAIRYNIPCSVHSFDALEFQSHQTFYHSLPVKPDIAIYVIGYMTDNEKAIAEWDEALKTIGANFTGAVSILNIISADYRSKGSGTIVGISSVAGERGRQSNYIYGSAKAGFSSFLSGLRNKMFHHGVHVMTVKPGFIYTKMTEHLKLPGLLTATPEQVATSVFNGVRKKKNTIYVKWFWRWIMLIIKFVPEFIFKKKKL